MDFNNPALILALAFITDILFGDPQYKYHPVRIMGYGISFILYILKKIRLNDRFRGILLSLIMPSLSLLVYSGIYLVLRKIHPLPAVFYNIFMCYSFIALKDLLNHIRPVIEAMESNDLAGARMVVSMVVGRDVKYLDRSGVTRAAVETMAENYVDGFLSPVFWYVVGSVSASFTAGDPVFYGISLMIIFKVVSTLDSMVGHKNKEFIKTGWAGARLDDAMNYIPARLSLAVLFMGSWFGNFHPIDGLRAALRDRLKHDSPNSAHPESFFAGALHIRLAGPIKYIGGIKDYPWLGAEYDDPGVRHIKMGMGLTKVSSWIAVSIACFILFL